MERVTPTRDELIVAMLTRVRASLAATARAIADDDLDEAAVVLEIASDDVAETVVALRQAVV